MSAKTAIRHGKPQESRPSRGHRTVCGRSDDPVLFVPQQAPHGSEERKGRSVPFRVRGFRAQDILEDREGILGGQVVPAVMTNWLRGWESFLIPSEFETPSAGRAI